MNKKIGVALTSVFASLFLTLIKLIVGLMTGSIGILSEAAHSLLDLGAAGLTFFAVKIGEKPPDKNHPYGHGKVESISALIETGLLFLTSAWIMYEAALRLMTNHQEIEITWYAFAVMLISIIIDFSRSHALQKTAKETKSQALEADALHFSSDILSSAVVILGLALSLAGVQKADAYAAIGVALFVLHAGYSLGKRTIDVLIDAAPEGLTDKVIAIAESVEGVVEVKKARVRDVGASAFVEICIAVGRNVSMNTAKEITNTIQNEIREIITECDITIETEPVSLSNETIIDEVQIVAHKHQLLVHDIVVHTEYDKRYLSFDLEVNASTPFKEAHHIATGLENLLREELGDSIEVTIHIEPLQKDAVRGVPLSKNEYITIEAMIHSVAKEISAIKEIHDIKMRKTGKNIFVSLHSIFKDNESLETVHEATSVLENMIRLKLPSVKRVLVHPEPISEKND